MKKSTIQSFKDYRDSLDITNPNRELISLLIVEMQEEKSISNIKLLIVLTYSLTLTIGMIGVLLS